MADRAFLERLTKELADQGKIIEGGWVALRTACIPLDAPPAQLHEMRMAYIAGARHLFTSIIAMLDPGTEETEADFRRMDLIHAELEAFRGELELWVAKAIGNG
jgi:hypothetical protein